MPSSGKGKFEKSTILRSDKRTLKKKFYKSTSRHIEPFNTGKSTRASDKSAKISKRKSRKARTILGTNKKVKSKLTLFSNQRTKKKSKTSAYVAVFNNSSSPDKEPTGGFDSMG